MAIRTGRVGALFCAVSLLLSIAGTEGLGAKRRSAPPAPSARQLLSRARPAVVTVYADDAAGDTFSMGSGVVVRADGVVITAWHVIAGASDVVVRTSTGGYYEVKGLLGWDRQADYAVLQLSGKGFSALPLGDSGAVRQGDRVYAIGDPAGLEATASEGIISSVREVPGGGKWLQLTAPISKGSSGGPVLNAKGQVIGLASFIVTDGQNLNFAIPVNRLKPVLRAKSQPTPVAKVKEQLRVKAAEVYARGEAALPEDDEDPEAAGKYLAALVLYREAAALDPEDSEAAYSVGYCLSRLGKREEAVVAYLHACELNPVSPFLLRLLVEEYGELGRWEEAAAHCQERVEADETDSVAHYGLGIVYKGQGKKAEATTALLRSLELNTDSAMQALSVGEALDGLGESEKAIEAYQKAIQFSPDLMEARLSLWVAYLDLGRLEEAVEAAKGMIQADPKDALGYGALADGYRELKKPQEAIAAYQDAIRVGAEAGESKAWVHHGLGDSYADLEQWKEAAAAYQQAIKASPDDAASHYGLAVAYHHQNNRGEALKEYAALKDLDKELADKLFKLLYPE